MWIYTYPVIWRCERMVDLGAFFLWPWSAAHLFAVCAGAVEAMPSVCAMEFVALSARGSAASTLRSLLSSGTDSGEGDGCPWCGGSVGAVLCYAGVLLGDHAAIHCVNR